MLRNKSVFLACLLGVVFAGFSAHATVSVKGGWDSGGTANSNSISNNDFTLAGCYSSDWNSNCHGTWGDEGAVVLNIARKFNDNGGYFCPTQIQFANSNNKRDVWINLYKPEAGADCRWICKPGYKGENCSTQDTGNECGTTSMKNLKNATQRVTGKGSNKVSETIEIFDLLERWGSKSRDASITVLAIVGYYEHGVLVGRLKVTGTRDWNGGDVRSWVTGTSHPTERFLLCDKGYKPNATKTDCEVSNRAACGLPPDPMCSGWTQAEYQANETDLEYRQIGSCFQYRCVDRNKAFPSAANRTCQDCSSGVRGGADRITGVCKVCALGQYFDENTNECKAAVGYSRTDLQYGKDKTKNNTPIVSNQCWTKTSPDEYKNCVAGITTTGGGTSNNNSGVGIGSLNFNRIQDISNATLQLATPSSNNLEQLRR